ncbi:MAG: type II toxin-antitoxin system RelE/ParE family toxin [Clostridia bacterium]|nr:type II toxin-antitoxin system RelE/ParE family toxin [Clostridia bacterium]
MKVRILPSAWEGLARIKYRVRADFGEDVAQRVTDQILNSLERLERFPDSGSMTPDPWLNNMGFRMVISDKRNVSIFRRVDEDIFVYIIADTLTEYTKVFTEMIIASPDMVTEFTPDSEQKQDQ